MKLVDILARELSEWPVGASHACMTEEGLSFTEGGPPGWNGIRFSILHGESDVLWLLRACTKETYGLQECEEHLVTHGEWQSARAAYLLTQQPAQDPQLSKIGKSMTKANKDGWIRHRGGKCPVEAGTLVDVRYRDGDISFSQPALMKGKSDEAWAHDWGHSDSCADIVAWRPAKTEAKEVEDSMAKIGEAMSETTEESEERFSGEKEAPNDPVSLRQQWESLGHEIKSNECSIKAIQEAIAGLIERQEAIKAELKAAGFLIYAEAEPVKVDYSKDMSDPRNWLVGDVFIARGGYSFDGCKARLTSIGIEDDMHRAKPLISDDCEEYLYCTRELVFHSRP